MPERFAYYEFVNDWPEFAVATNELEYRLRAGGRPVAADMLLAAYGQFRDELLAIAGRMSIFATETMRKLESESRVRPDTMGEGGPRLGDSLVAEPVGDQSLVPGSVGVADLDVLDKNVPWWITNEIGSRSRVGHLIYGFFYGGDDFAPPSRQEYQVHPLFQAGTSPVSGGGIIENPIPARRFIVDSVPIIDREWKAVFAAAKGRMETQMARAQATFR